MFWNPSTSQSANQISCQSVKLPFLSELTTNSFIFSAVDLSILDTSWYIHLPLFAWPQSFVVVIHSSAHLFNPAASTCPFSPSFIQDPCYQLRQTSCSFVCLCLFVCWFVTHSLPVLVSFPIVWKLRSAQHLLIVMLFQFGRSFVHSFIHPFIRSWHWVCRSDCRSSSKESLSPRGVSPTGFTPRGFSPKGAPASCGSSLNAQGKQGLFWERNESSLA